MRTLFSPPSESPASSKAGDVTPTNTKKKKKQRVSRDNDDDGDDGIVDEVVWEDPKVSTTRGKKNKNRS